MPVAKTGIPIPRVKDRNSQLAFEQIINRLNSLENEVTNTATMIARSLRPTGSGAVQTSAGGTLTVTSSSTNADGNIVVNFSDGSSIIVPSGGW